MIYLWHHNIHQYALILLVRRFKQVFWHDCIHLQNNNNVEKKMWQINRLFDQLTKPYDLTISWQSRHISLVKDSHRSSFTRNYRRQVRVKQNCQITIHCHCIWLGQCFIAPDATTTPKQTARCWGYVSLSFQTVWDPSFPRVTSRLIQQHSKPAQAMQLEWAVFTMLV